MSHRAVIPFATLHLESNVVLGQVDGCLTTSADGRFVNYRRRRKNFPSFATKNAVERHLLAGFRGGLSPGWCRQARRDTVLPVSTTVHKIKD
jgi:hypothetical protein